MTPKNITQGITYKWSVSLNDYPSSSWTLVYTSISPHDKQVINASADGDDYLMTLSMADSSNFKAGRYDYQAMVTNGSERYVVEKGEICIDQDFSMLNSFDGRSDLRKIVDSIDAYLLGNATKEEQKVRFNDREIWKHSRLELKQLREGLKIELQAEEKAAALANGTNTGTRIRTVFR